VDKSACRASQTIFGSGLTSETTAIASGTNPLRIHSLRKSPIRAGTDTGVRGQKHVGSTAEAAGWVVDAGETGGRTVEAKSVFGVGTGGTGWITFVFIE